MSREFLSSRGFVFLVLFLVLWLKRKGESTGRMERASAWPVQPRYLDLPRYIKAPSKV